MAPVRKSGGGQSSAGKSSGAAQVAGGGVVQREINGDIEFSYVESAAESGSYQSRGLQESGSERFQGRALPGLSTEFLDEHEKSISAGTPPVFRAAASPFSGARPDNSGGGFGAASFGGGSFGAAGGGGGTFQQENVLGADTRERVTGTATAPYEWICLLEMVSGNGTPLMGSGWLCGNSTVVTAGHCVYDGNGPMRSIKVYAGRNKLDSQGTANATATKTTKEWLNSFSQANDYAAIQLDQPLGQRLKFFQFADFPDSDLNNLLVNISGYPADKNQGSMYGTMWGSTNRIVRVSAQQLSYLVDTKGGQSGSPVIAFDGTTAYVTGIHNYGGNSSNTATRINSQVFDKITSWVQ